MGSYRVISADDHVFEPSDLWTSRIEPKFRDRAPRIVRMDDAFDWWVCEDRKLMSMQAGAQAGVRLDAPERLSRTDLFENVRPGGYIPEERIKDMDADGVDVSIIYPTVGLLLFREPDNDFLTSLFSTYNNWLSEYCKPFPRRLMGIAMVNVDNLESAIKELERCANLGFAGVMITSYPIDTPTLSRSYDSPEYEPLWAAAQDLDMPLSLHLGTNRAAPDNEFGRENTTGRRPGFSSNTDHRIRVSIAHMIFTGIFERYPKLQVGSVEQELSWVPYFLDRMDFTYSQRPTDFAPYRFKEAMLPSQFFHRNVFLGFQEDALGIRLRDIIGVDSLQWGSDYPHTESTFPKSREILEEILADCTEEEKAKIAGGNAARIYRIN